MIALLIDADNLCVSAWVDEAINQLENLGGTIAIRRAYGSADKLKGLTEVLRSRHIRPFTNLALSKNTTDVALAVDAMELSYQAARPEVIVIGSGDADFVPLVLRLRERGFRMLCVSERGKMAAEAVHAYDQVLLVGQERVQESAPQAAAEAPSPVITLPTVAPAAPQSTAKVAAPKKTAPAKAPKAAATKVVAKKVAQKTAPKAQISVEQILQVASALRSGQLQPLNVIGKLLHDGKLVGKNASSSKLFKQFPQHFELVPPKQPNQVRYLGSA